MFKDKIKKYTIPVLSIMCCLTTAFTSLANNETKTITAPENSIIVINGSLSKENTDSVVNESKYHLAIFNGPTGAGTNAPGYSDPLHIDIHSEKSTLKTTNVFGSGADAYKENKYVARVTGAGKWDDLPTITNNICDSNSVYVIMNNKLDNTLYTGAGQDFTDETANAYVKNNAYKGLLSEQYAIKLNNVTKSKTNGKKTIIGYDTGSGTPDLNDGNTYTYNIVNSTNDESSIYPASYPDIVYLSPDKITELIPWFANYEIANGRILPTTDANRISYNSTYRDTYYNSSYINNVYQNMTGSRRVFMTRSIDGTRTYPNELNIDQNTTYNFEITAELDDNISTEIVSGVSENSEIIDMENVDDFSVTNGNAEFIATSYLTSTWQISQDKLNWINITTGGTGKKIKYNMLNGSLTVDTDGLNPVEIKVSDFVSDPSTFYVRRVSSAPMVCTYYKNVASPAIKIRALATTDSFELIYNGSGVVQNTTVDGGCYTDGCPGHRNAVMDMVGTIYFDNGTTKVFTGNDLADNLFFDNPYIGATGNNVLHYYFIDPETNKRYPEDITAFNEIVIPGIEAGVSAFTAEYKGLPIPALTSAAEYSESLSGGGFSMKDVTLHVVKENHANSSLNADTFNVGILNPAEYQKEYSYTGSFIDFYKDNYDKVIKGDADENNVLNQRDADMLADIIKNNTVIESSLIKKVDIDENGVVNNNDLDLLKRRISRAIIESELDADRAGKTFYIAYAGFPDEATGIPNIRKITIPVGTKQFKNMSLISQPTKLKYIEGDSFDPSGMIIRITYNNGDYTDYKYPTNSADAPKIGGGDVDISNLIPTDKIIPVTYQDDNVTKTVNISISVTAKKLTSIKVEAAPNKTSYAAGESFDPSGLVISAYYDEDKAADESHTPYSVQLEPGQYSITNNKRLQNSNDYILLLPDNASLATEGMGGYTLIKKSAISNPGEIGVVGEHVTITRADNGETISGVLAGNNYVKVTYTATGVATSVIVPITVGEKTVTMLTVQQSPFKQSYVSGQKFDATGLLLKAVYSDGTSGYVYKKSESLTDGYECDDSVLMADNTAVEVTYADKSIMIPITVVEPNIESITASYTEAGVKKTSSIKPECVNVIITYLDGSTEVINGSAKNDDGSPKIRITPATSDGSFDISVENLGVREKGTNYFAAVYGGKSSIFTVYGMDNGKGIDYSSSVARSKRRNNTWSEDFTATKVLSVADYISTVSKDDDGIDDDMDLLGDATTDEENHYVEKQKNTDTARTNLKAETGTAKTPDASAEYVSPLMNFLRFGTEPQKESVISVSYRSKTVGFMFPETNNPKFQIEDPNDYRDVKYIKEYSRIRGDILESEDGWSDWVGNGDSVGTVNAGRIALNYGLANDDGTPNNNTDSITVYMDKMQLKLTDVPEGSSAGLRLIYEDVSGTEHVFNNISDADVLINPARIKIELTGNVPVKDSTGETVSKPFDDEYKIYYRVAIDDAQQWSASGEYAGTPGQRIQTFEAHIMNKNTYFDIGSETNKPIITEQPRSQRAVIGGTATFKVLSSNSSNVGYQWYCNDAIIEGATSDVYTTGVLSSSDDGNVYYCIVTNQVSNKSVTSATAILTVKESVPVVKSCKYILKTTDASGNPIETEETNVSGNINAKPGDHLKLKVVAESISSDPTYLWEMTDALGNWVGMDGGNTANYEMDLAQNMHGRMIRCTVSNHAGPSSSSVAVINCLEEPKLQLVTKNNNKYITKQAGSITIEANAITSVYDGIQSFTWKVNGVTYSGGKQFVLDAPKLQEGVNTVECTVYSQGGAKTCTEQYFYGDVPTLTLSSSGNDPYTITRTMSSNDDNANVSSTWVCNGDALLFRGSAVKETYVGNAHIILSSDGNTLTIEGLETGKTLSIGCIVEDGFTRLLNSAVSKFIVVEHQVAYYTYD